MLLQSDGHSSRRTRRVSPRGLGIRWVLVEKDMAAGRVPSGEVVHSGPGLDLVDLGRAAEVDGTGPPPAVVLAADGLVIGVLGAAVAAVFVRRLRTARDGGLAR